jgi:NhaP-type Na+/H+ or K+/H+ antiporter
MSPDSRRRPAIYLERTGMRGGVALAAAIALPETLAGRRPFPERNLIVFPTFRVILVTLVLQGLTLRPLESRAGGSTRQMSRVVDNLQFRSRECVRGCRADAVLLDQYGSP